MVRIPILLLISHKNSLLLPLITKSDKIQPEIFLTNLKVVYPHLKFQNKELVHLEIVVSNKNENIVILELFSGRQIEMYFTKENDLAEFLIFLKNFGKKWFPFLPHELIFHSTNIFQKFTNFQNIINDDPIFSTQISNQPDLSNYQLLTLQNQLCGRFPGSEFNFCFFPKFDESVATPEKFDDMNWLYSINDFKTNFVRRIQTEEWKLFWRNATTPSYIIFQPRCPIALIDYYDSPAFVTDPELMIANYNPTIKTFIFIPEFELSETNSRKCISRPSLVAHEQLFQASNPQNQKDAISKTVPEIKIRSSLRKSSTIKNQLKSDDFAVKIYKRRKALESHEFEDVLVTWTQKFMEMWAKNSLILKGLEIRQKGETFFVYNKRNLIGLTQISKRFTKNFAQSERSINHLENSSIYRKINLKSNFPIRILDYKNKQLTLWKEGSSIMFINVRGEPSDDLLQDEKYFSEEIKKYQRLEPWATQVKLEEIDNLLEFGRHRNRSF